MRSAYNVFFNMGAVNDAALAPETSNDYEAGIKSTWFDERLRANLTGFITDFQNFQANFTQSINGGLVTNLINAGAVSTKGVELDTTAHPIDAATLNFNLLWDDAKVDNFFCPPNAPTSCNINGQPLPFAPAGNCTSPATTACGVPPPGMCNWKATTTSRARLSIR